MIERRVICQKFQNFVWNETYNLHVSAVKYSLPNLHKSSIPPKLGLPTFCEKLPPTQNFTEIEQSAADL